MSPTAAPAHRLAHGNHITTAAPLLAGVVPKAAERLGHASPQPFNDTYAHRLAELDADGAAKLQGVNRRRRGA